MQLQKILLHQRFRAVNIVLLVAVFGFVKYFFRFSFEIQELFFNAFHTSNVFVHQFISFILSVCSMLFDMSCYFLICFLITKNLKYSSFLIWFYGTIALVYVAIRSFSVLSGGFNEYAEALILDYRNQLFSPVIVMFYMPAFYLYKTHTSIN